MTELLNMPLWLLVTVAVVVFCGAAFQNLIGIGFGLITSPFLLILDHRLLPAVILMLGLLSSIPNAVASLPRLNWTHCTVATGGRLVGTFLGVFLLMYYIKDTGSTLFSIVLAITLLAFIIISLFSKWSHMLRLSIPNLIIAGTISGISGTITSIGGPPLALLYRLENPVVARANLNFQIGLGALFSLVALALSGFIGMLQLQAAALLSIPAILGIFLSNQFTYLANKYFKNAILGIITVAACVIIFRAIPNKNISSFFDYTF